MIQHPITRRTALQSLVAGTAAVAARSTSAVDAPADPPIVDCHLHIATSSVSTEPGGKPPTPFDLILKHGGYELLGAMIDEQLVAAGVTDALCMPTIVSVDDGDPLGLGPTLKQASFVKRAKLHFIGAAHPERFDRNHLARVEEVLKQGQVKAFKAYLGYLHYKPTYEGYLPYYRLAAKYDVPVIFHTGDTYGKFGKVRFAHPLAVDELAIDHPATKFVLAHFGNPWVLDAAEVAYKNDNVWVDLSAFLIGEPEDFAKYAESGVRARTIRRIQEGIDFTEKPEKFVFGSDWPLAPITTYRDFVKDLFPKEHHAKVLGETARKLFKL
jgi:predicted TIM-barrel fold metal-dependent hydrolase